MNILGSIELRDSVADFADVSLLNGAVDVVSTQIGGAWYYFVASYYDHGVQVLRQSGDQLENVAAFADTSDVGLYGARELRIVEVGGKKLLIVAGAYDQALTSFAIETVDAGRLGQLTALHRIVDDSRTGGSEPALDAPYGMETVVTSKGSFVVVTADTDDAISVYRVSANGQFTLVSSAADTDNADFNLNGAYSVEIVQRGGRTFVYATSTYQDSGISVFEMSDTGVLSGVQHFNVNGTNSANIESIAHVQSGGKNFVIVTDHAGDELITYRMAADGSLTEVGRLDYRYLISDDKPMYELTGLEPVYVEGVPFLIAQSEYYDRMAVFGVGADGSLTLSSHVTLPAELDGAYETTVTSVGSRVFVVVTAFDGDRVTLLELGAADDPLVGTAAADRIVGMNGDDDLMGLGGNDELRGGAGDDVLSGRMGNDTLVGGADADALVGGAGDDLLIGGSGADFLLGGAGRDTVSYTGSQVGVQVSLATGIAVAGDATGDVFSGIENITGSEASDNLTGDSGANALRGAGGRDDLAGGEGADTLAGGAGNDSVDGGAGRDRLLGEAGNDTLDGGAGDDVLTGGAGDDHAQGGEGDDALSGDAGADRLDGGLGNDTLTGGGGADQFVISAGDDEIADFDVTIDRIDLSAFAGFDSLADVQAVAFTFAGNVVLQGGSLPGSVILTGVTEAELTAANFIF